MAANGHVAGGTGHHRHHQQQQQGGQKFIDSINFDDPEYIKETQRPADIAEDLKEMQKRERVTEVLSAAGFRNELEDIVREALSLGTQSAESVAVLQQISELVAPLTSQYRQNGFTQATKVQQNFDLPLVPGNAAVGAGAFPSSQPRARIVPVNDLKHNKSEEYGGIEERQLRCKLAALYRLIDFLGWSEGIYNNTITVRLPAEGFLVNPFGLMYSEITASSLMKADANGNISSRGSSNFGLNEAGLNLHLILHAARPDVVCIIHCCTKNAAAVSAMKCGLLPVSQEALTIGNVSYFDDYSANGNNSGAAGALGSNSKVLMLRNNGFLACGATVEEAFHMAYSLMKACEIQVCAMSAGGAQELVQVDDRVKSSGGTAQVNITGSKKQWGVGELEYEAWMRVLDTLGYHTGYPYKEPLLKSLTSGVHAFADGGGGGAGIGHQRHNRDVEYPPFAASLFSHNSNVSDEQRLQTLRELIEKRKEAERTRWINTPNNYSKVEITEVGTEKPAVITKWVRGGTGTDRGAGLLASPSGMARLNITNGPTTAGTPIKISSSLQFAPVGTDAREMRLKRDEMQQKRLQGAITSGPETKRVNWEEADQLADAMQKGERVVTVSAVSKGIIKPEQVHNVGSYTQQWARNPFLNVTDEELNAYKREITDTKQQQPPNGSYITSSHAGPMHTNVGYEHVQQSGARQPYGVDNSVRSSHREYSTSANDNKYGMADAGVDAKSGQESVAVAKKKKKGLFSFGSTREKKDKSDKRG